LLIGITGGIGAGKSTVCRVFEWLHVPVYYADDEAKKLINSNKELKKDIKRLLGKESYDANGFYNRAFVSEMVFKNSGLLEQLNQIIHPAVALHFENWTLENSNSKYLLKEAAILFESGSHKKMDKIIGVQAPLSVRIERVNNRDRIPNSAIKARIDNQMSQDEKMKLCDYIITNDGIELIVPQVVNIHRQISMLENH